MKVTQSQFEGTPDEFKTVAHLFGVSPTPNQEAPSDETTGAGPSVEPQSAIRCMLTRIPISDGQMAVYKALADGRLEHAEFLKRIGRSAGQMAGVLGALGRRIANTKEILQAGLPGNVNAVLRWERERDKWYISLTPDALEALRAENIL